MRNDVRKTEGKKKDARSTVLGVSAVNVFVIAGAGLLLAWMIGTAAFLTWGGG